MNNIESPVVPGPLKKYLPYVLSFALAALLVRCAGEVAPGGGPRDLTPPAIVRSDPDTNAVRVSTQSVELEFNKYVDRRSFEESVFISPYVGPLEFDWGGTNVTIRFSEPLRKHTTYVVNVGTDVIDLRERNRMAGFTLAFSTGDSIDPGFISGRVFDEKPEGVMVFAYALAGVNPDTLDPAKDKPDYIMQTGKAGVWTLSHMAFGSYRLFAFRDEYHNLLYDKEIDQYGVLPAEVAVTPGKPRVADVWFRLAKEDTTKPFITSARALDRDRLLVRFSEPMDSLSFPDGTFTIEDTLSGRQVPVVVHYLMRPTPALASVVTATPLDSAVTYRLRISGVFDRAGNPIDTAHASWVLAGSNRPDTLKPTIAILGLRDSTRGYPVDQPIEFDFSKPVIHNALTAAVMLRDSLRRPVDAELRWMNATDAVLLPRGLLMSRAWYQVRIVLDSVRDVHGTGYRDSTAVIRFQTVDLRTTGEISGSVIDEEPNRAKGRIYVTASSIDLRPQRERTVGLDGPGNFRLDRLVEGKYVLSGYRDSDSSGSFTYGKPFPFEPSERFVPYADTIRVRARWAVGGVTLRLK